MSFPLLTIDVESGGCQVTRHPLIAIGVDFRLVEPSRQLGSNNKRIFRFPFDIKDFEPRCMEEFWSKNMDKLEKLKALPISTIADFAQYVDELDAKYPDLVIMADNPTFDVGFINYLYDRDLNRKPLQYRADGKYRIIVDQNSYLWATMPELKDPWVWDSTVIKKFNLQLTSVHDHMPDNDAEHIADMFMAVYQKRSAF